MVGDRRQPNPPPQSKKNLAFEVTKTIKVIVTKNNVIIVSKSDQAAVKKAVDEAVRQSASVSLSKELKAAILKRVIADPTIKEGFRKALTAALQPGGAMDMDRELAQKLLAAIVLGRGIVSAIAKGEAQFREAMSNISEREFRDSGIKKEDFIKQYCAQFTAEVKDIVKNSSLGDSKGQAVFNEVELEVNLLLYSPQKNSPDKDHNKPDETGPMYYANNNIIKGLSDLAVMSMYESIASLFNQDGDDDRAEREAEEEEERYYEAKAEEIAYKEKYWNEQRLQKISDTNYFARKRLTAAITEQRHLNRQSYIEKSAIVVKTELSFTEVSGHYESARRALQEAFVNISSQPLTLQPEIKAEVSRLGREADWQEHLMSRAARSMVSAIAEMPRKTIEVS
ncbi:hypothetical protein ACFL4D_02810 [Candidatus Margulisiibacteriota bacterium]